MGPVLLAHGDLTDRPLDFHLHPDVLAVVALVAAAYWLALTRLGPSGPQSGKSGPSGPQSGKSGPSSPQSGKSGPSGPQSGKSGPSSPQSGKSGPSGPQSGKSGPRIVPAGTPAYGRRQVRLLAAGVATLLVFSEWPVHDLAEGYLYSVHMVQHSAYTLVLPPLFILGTPAWLWRWLLRPVMGAFRAVTRPWVAVTVFSAVTVATHLPPTVTAAVRSGPAHFGQHLVLVLAAVVVWWPLLGPLPEAPRLTAPVHRMVYVFCQSLAPSMVGSALIWATTVPYRVYEEYPAVWGISDLDDQRWAGTIMEAFEGALLLALMVVIFLPLVRRELRSPTPVMDRLGRVPEPTPE